MPPCVRRRPFFPKLLPRADLDWKALVPAIGRATWALARYDGILHGVPDPAVLLSPPHTQEAVLSSKIEGTARRPWARCCASRGGVSPQQAASRAREDIQEILR